MHARELVDLAAVVAIHTSALLRTAHDIPEQNAETYWVASKCRLDRWGRSLKRLTALVQSTGMSPDGLEQRAFRGLLEEILASEVLTRVWSAAMCQYDRTRGTDRMEPIARSVLIGQIEARHRVLTILVGRSGLTAEESMRLNALRRRSERWTDVLIGYLAGEHDVREFAADPDRAADFAADFTQRRQVAGSRYAWPMTVASLQAAFREWLEPVSPNSDLNARIAASILTCFPREVFDGLGTMQSPWLLRISQITGEAEGMLNELLGEPLSGPASSPAAPRDLRPDSWGRFRA